MREMSRVSQSEAVIWAIDQSEARSQTRCSLPTWARGPWRGSWASCFAWRGSPHRSWRDWPPKRTQCWSAWKKSFPSKKPGSASKHRGHGVMLILYRKLWMSDVGDVTRVRRQRRILRYHFKHAGGLLKQIYYESYEAGVLIINIIYSKRIRSI